MKAIDEFYGFLFELGAKRKFVPVFEEGDLFHYTSPEGMNSILFSNENEIELFASRCDCVNDTSEGKYIIDVYNEAITELCKENQITDRQFYNIKSIMPSDKELIYTYDENRCVSVAERKCNKYICCFSTDGDSLAMWNYYSKNSKYQGYNIAFFDIEAMESLRKYFSGTSIKWYKVIYDCEEKKKLIKDFVLEILKYFDNVSISSIKSVISSQLAEWGRCFKHPCFAHEKEVRVVVSIPQDEEHELLPVEYRQKDMFIIPFIRLRFSKESLSAVTISPLYCTDGEKEQQIKILKERLKRNKYETCDVNPSQVPIRY